MLVHSPNTILDLMAGRNPPSCSRGSRRQAVRAMPLLLVLTLLPDPHSAPTHPGSANHHRKRLTPSASGPCSSTIQHRTRVREAEP